jgi:hypothetical protein
MEIYVVNAAQVHSPPGGCESRIAERAYATVLAKEVFRRPRAELMEHQIILARQDFEMLCLYCPPYCAFTPADRAVALDCRSIGVLVLENDFPAMTRSLLPRHSLSPVS